MNINAAKTSVALQEVRAVHANMLPVSTSTTTNQRQLPTHFDIPAFSELNWIFLISLITIVAGVLLMFFCRKALWHHRRKKKIDQLQQLFGIIAHDLRSPFKSYHNLVELLDHYGKKQDWNSIKMIAQELEVTSRNLDLLLDTIFHWHLLKGGKFKPKIIHVNVATILKKIIPIYQQIARNNGRYIDFNITNCTKISVEQTFTTLIFRNLIDNAVKYAPRGSTITIKLTGDNSILECAVSNSFHPGSLEIVTQLCTAFTHKKDGIQTGIGIHFMLEAARAINAKMKARIDDKENRLTIVVMIPFI